MINEAILGVVGNYFVYMPKHRLAAQGVKSTSRRLVAAVDVIQRFYYEFAAERIV